MIEPKSLKKYIILQKLVLFRVDWRRLYSSSEYELILIVAQDTLTALPENQRVCFSQIHSLEKFTKENIAECILAIKIDPAETYIITNDELCIEMAAQLRSLLQLKGDTVDTVQPFLNKLMMKGKIAAAEIAMPKYVPFLAERWRNSGEEYLAEIVQQLGWPIFAKPIDSAASLNTTKLMDFNSLRIWAQQHANCDNYELDEYIHGKIFHCDSLNWQNKSELAFVAVSAYPWHEFPQRHMAGSIIVGDEALLEQIRQFNHRVVAALKPLPNSVTHLEFFQRPNGELVFLEIACRAPGGMIVQMYEKYAGINIEQCHFALQMGLSVDFSVHQTLTPTAWAWFPKKQGILKGWRIIPMISEYAEDWYVKKGQYLENAESLVDRAGGILLWHPDQKILQGDFANLANLTESLLIVEESEI